MKMTYCNWKILCVILLSVTGITVRSAPVNEVLRKELHQAVAAEGKDYLDQRNRLIEEYKKTPEAFQAIKAEDMDWRVGLLVSILAERATKEELVQRKVLNVSVGQTTLRYDLARVDSIDRSLARNARATPMVLVEKIWKGNEYTNTLGGARIRYSGVMMAIGRLNPPYAREVLESVVTNRNYFIMRSDLGLQSERDENGNMDMDYVIPYVQNIRSFAAKALGLIKDERSVPALLMMWEEKAHDTRDAMSIYAYDSLTNCATKKSVDMLKQSVEESRSAQFKATIEPLINQLSK